MFDARIIQIEVRTMVSINFGNYIYWQKRYKESPGERFDWLMPYQPLKPIINHFIPKDSKILYVGCGNSTLAEKMFDEGYTDITCIDFSKEVISQMINRYHNNEDPKKCRPELKFKVMDVVKMDYQSSTFDFVVDKSLLDSVLCAEDATRKALRMLRQVNRVLKLGGKYLMFSHSHPKNRIFLLRNKLVKMQVQCFPFSISYAFIQKLIKLEENSKFNLQEVINCNRTKEESRTSKVPLNKQTKVEHYVFICTKENQTNACVKKSEHKKDSSMMNSSQKLSQQDVNDEEKPEENDEKEVVDQGQEAVKEQEQKKDQQGNDNQIGDEQEEQPNQGEEQNQERVSESKISNKQSKQQSAKDQQNQEPADKEPQQQQNYAAEQGQFDQDS